MTTTWIDFKAVKEKARFEPLLDRYKLEMKSRGKELVGLCPFHKDTRPSLGVNVERRLFNCFGCKARGTVIEFVSRMENVSVKRAAELVIEWQHLEDVYKEAPRRGERRGARSGSAPRLGKQEPEPERRVEPAEVAVNPPLKFQLKLDPKHPYLAERNVSPEMREIFGLGFSSRGVMKNRICAPIHDLDGVLVGYIGRWPGEPPEGEEKWKLPQGFHKTQVLFNQHRVRREKHLVLVEGFWDVVRLHSLEIPSVSPIGTDLSERQVELLKLHGAERVTLLLDGDDAGRRAAKEMLELLGKDFDAVVAELPEGEDPDSVDEAELRRALAGRI
jgi:DNA primase